jgi:ribosomal protein L37AE/L43A
MDDPRKRPLGHCVSLGDYMAHIETCKMLDTHNCPDEDLWFDEKLGIWRCRNCGWSQP